MQLEIKHAIKFEGPLSFNLKLFLKGHKCSLTYGVGMFQSYAAAYATYNEICMYVTPERLMAKPLKELLGDYASLNWYENMLCDTAYRVVYDAYVTIKYGNVLMRGTSNRGDDIELPFGDIDRLVATYQLVYDPYAGSTVHFAEWLKHQRDKYVKK